MYLILEVHITYLHLHLEFGQNNAPTTITNFGSKIVTIVSADNIFVSTPKNVELFCDGTIRNNNTVCHSN